MMTKGKIALGALVIGGVVLALASTASAKTKPPAPKRKVEEEEDILVTTPEGSVVAVEVDESGNVPIAPSVPSVPPVPSVPSVPPVPSVPSAPSVPSRPSTPPPTPIDQKAEQLAAEAGKPVEEVVAEVVKTITQNQQTSPIAREETKRENDPHGTIALARDMLARELLPGWRKDSEMRRRVGLWQQRVGLVPDDSFGPKSAARMAREVAILPLVREWPKAATSKTVALKMYDAELSPVVESLATGLPDTAAHITALTRSMQREKAQSFGVANPPPQPTMEVANTITNEIAQSAERIGIEELTKK